MTVHPSAHKHGVSTEDAIQAAEWSLWIEPIDDGGPPDRDLCCDRLEVVREGLGAVSDVWVVLDVDRGGIELDAWSVCR